MLPELRAELAAAARGEGQRVMAVLSPFLTCEEAYLFARYFKGLSSDVRLALGHVPVIGQDDTYPKDRRGNPIQPVKFTIRAEKCPNRRGVEAILKHFQGEVIGWDAVLRAAGAGELRALYVTAGYSPRAGHWVSEEQAAQLKQVPLLVVQDLFQNAATAAAKYVLPAASFAEKEGTFVNHAGLAQGLRWAVRTASRTDGQIALDLMQRRGLLHAPTLRKELAEAVPYFAPLASGDLGEYGVLLP